LLQNWQDGHIYQILDFREGGNKMAEKEERKGEGMERGREETRQMEEGR